MNRIPRRVARVATLLALTAALAVGSGAAAHGPTPILGGGWWDQNETLGYRWRSGAEPAADIKAAIKAAAADVAESKASRAASFVYDSGGSPIGYGPGATCGVNGIACFTRTVGSGFTMWLREQGHVFDWGVLRWCQMYDSPPNGCYDAETIALDEFGHIEGLAHHDNHGDDSDYGDSVVQTFSRTKPKAHYDMHAFGRCDVATLQREYDVPNTGTRYSTCLDLATVLTLAAEPRGVVPGGLVSFTAVLRVADRDSYDRLGNNPVSSRTVRLQRRAIGASTWATVTTMAPTTASGTYAAAIRPQVSGEYRALFSTPSDEGINGDGSGVVTIVVSSALVAPMTHAD